MQSKARLAVNRRVVPFEIVHGDADTCGIQNTFALFHGNRSFQWKVYDKHGTVLFNVLRSTRVKDFALGFVNLRASEENCVMLFAGEHLSAELILELRILDVDGTVVGEHVDRTRLDAAGDLEDRKLLFVGERGIEFVHDNVKEISGDFSRLVVVDCKSGVRNNFGCTRVIDRDLQLVEDLDDATAQH